MSTKRIPFYDLRDWWLSDTRLSQLLNPTGNPSNFFPSNQDPQSKAPYVRYSVKDYNRQDSYWERRQDAVVVLYMDRDSNLNEAVSIMREMAGREDESAVLLNRWLLTQGRGREFAFKSIRFIIGDDVIPAEELGGDIIRPLIFSMEYVDLT